MKAVQTVEDKTRALQIRKREQRELGARIDRVIASSQDAELGNTTGCYGAVCRSLARTLGIRIHASSDLLAATELQSVAVQDTAHSRIFGVQKQPAVSKLEAATKALTKRVQSLEDRSEQHMEAVRNCMRAKKRDAAARELKKAKMYSKQAASSRAVLDAMEAQTDMMEQNALQKEIAKALAGTAKTMKWDKKLLGKAEDAVDSAAEMRDMHDELGQIMAGLGDQTTDFDEDDLRAELDAILESDKTIASEAAKSLEDEVAAADLELEKKHNECAEARRIRSKLPVVPTQRRIEKQSLLAAPRALLRGE